MSLRRYPPTDRNDEADRSSLGNNKTSPMSPTFDVPGRDSVRLPNETTSKSSLTDKLIAADPNYSKRPSGTFKFSHFSFEFC